MTEHKSLYFITGINNKFSTLYLFPDNIFHTKDCPFPQIRQNSAISAKQSAGSRKNKRIPGHMEAERYLLTSTFIPRAIRKCVIYTIKVCFCQLAAIGSGNLQIRHHKADANSRRYIRLVHILGE